MSIDGIGKGGGKPPLSGIDQPGSSSVTGSIGEASSEFKVAPSTVVEAPALQPLDQLRSGAISVSQYLDIKVNEATSHLDQRLGAEQLSFIRDSLREQLSTDPVLVELVRSATGALPPPTE
jgi:hypothetical protein